MDGYTVQYSVGKVYITYREDKKGKTYVGQFESLQALYWNNWVVNPSKRSL